MTQEQENFLKATSEIEEKWREKMRSFSGKPHYVVKGRKDFTKVYKCGEYTCDAHPHGCFFCKHLTDVWCDPPHGPYMWACELEKENCNLTHNGILGKCELFEEEK